MHPWIESRYFDTFVPTATRRSDLIVTLIICLSGMYGAVITNKDNGKCAAPARLPIDLIRMVASYMPEVLDNYTIRHAVYLYATNPTRCLKLYGAMEHWDTSKVTNMSKLFASHLPTNINLYLLYRYDGSTLAFYKYLMEETVPEGGTEPEPVAWPFVLEMHTTMTNPTAAPLDRDETMGLYRFMLFTHTMNVDISRWDVSNVTDMSSMFARNTHFKMPIGRWNISSVKNMQGMFYDKLRLLPFEWYMGKDMTHLRMVLRAYDHPDKKRRRTSVDK